MITHAGARTRALYMWEEDDLEHRKGVRPVKNLKDAVWIAEAVLPRWTGQIIPSKGRSNYCVGHSTIVLSLGSTDLILVHELTHAAGFGSRKQPHSAGFVKKYIELMGLWYNWNIEELLTQAKWRKLI